jgi:hypothetical protein
MAYYIILDNIKEFKKCAESDSVKNNFLQKTNLYSGAIEISQQEYDDITVGKILAIEINKDNNTISKTHRFEVQATFSIESQIQGINSIIDKVAFFVENQTYSNHPDLTKWSIFLSDLKTLKNRYQNDSGLIAQYPKTAFSTLDIVRSEGVSLLNLYSLPTE